MRVVVQTPDVVGERMAGPGIRAWHLAAELSKHFDTTLVARSEGSGTPSLPGGLVVRSEELGTPAAERALRAADVIIGQPARRFSRRRKGQKVVYDLFDPAVLELRELYGRTPDPRQRLHLAAEWWRLTEALLRADLLICAAPNQRRFYSELQAGEAPWIEVPFGIDPAEVTRCEKPRDNIVLWGGGLWEWLDPATAVEAILKVNRSGIRARLLFLGRARPNRSLIDRRREDRFDDLLARGEGYVAANEQWVPYRERLAWLRSSKIAVMLHRRTAEAEFAIRTRLFDAIAAATPVVATTGGFAAELVEKERLGLVVPPGDPDAVAAAIGRLLTDDALFTASVENLERIRPRYAWDVVTRPLVDAMKKWEIESPR